MTLKNLFKEQGIKHNTIAAKLWPGSSRNSQGTNMSQLMKGERKSVRPRFIAIIADALKMKDREIINILDPE